MSELNNYDGIDQVEYPENTYCGVRNFERFGVTHTMLRWLMPQGRAWDAKWTVSSNIFNLTKGIAEAAFEKPLESFSNFIRNKSIFCATVDNGLLAQHEEDYPLSGCFDISTMSEEDRRQLLYYKRLPRTWYTEKDFKFIADLLGVNIEIECAGCKEESYDYNYDFNYLDEESISGCSPAQVSYDYNYDFNYGVDTDLNTIRNTWTIHFPDIVDGEGYDYNYDFNYPEDVAPDSLKELLCIFNQLKPAHKVLKYSFGTNSPSCQ